jgi:hypothetical protein
VFGAEINAIRQRVLLSFVASLIGAPPYGLISVNAFRVLNFHSPRSRTNVSKGGSKYLSAKYFEDGMQRPEPTEDIFSFE